MCASTWGKGGFPHLPKPFSVCVKIRENSFVVMDMASTGLAGFLATTCVEHRHETSAVCPVDMGTRKGGWQVGEEGKKGGSIVGRGGKLGNEPFLCLPKA